jgi:hypothetical protein
MILRTGPNCATPHADPQGFKGVSETRKPLGFRKAYLGGSSRQAWAIYGTAEAVPFVQIRFFIQIVAVAPRQHRVKNVAAKSRRAGMSCPSFDSLSPRLHVPSELRTEKPDLYRFVWTSDLFKSNLNSITELSPEHSPGLRFKSPRNLDVYGD